MRRKLLIEEEFGVWHVTSDARTVTAGSCVDALVKSAVVKPTAVLSTSLTVPNLTVAALVIAALMPEK